MKRLLLIGFLLLIAVGCIVAALNLRDRVGGKIVPDDSETEAEEVVAYDASLTHMEGSESTTEYYAAFTDAINAASDGDVVTLLRDVDLGTVSVTIGKAITVNGNGHKISYNGDSSCALAVTVGGVTLNRLTVGSDSHNAVLISATEGEAVTVADSTLIGTKGVVMQSTVAVNFIGSQIASNTESYAIQINSGSSTVTVTDTALGYAESNTVTTTARGIHVSKASTVAITFRGNTTFDVIDVPFHFANSSWYNCTVDFSGLTSYNAVTRWSGFSDVTIQYYFHTTLENAIAFENDNTAYSRMEVYLVDDARVAASIDISEDLTLMGMGHTVASIGQHSIFTVTGDVAVTVNDLTMSAKHAAFTFNATAATLNLNNADVFALKTAENLGNNTLIVDGMQRIYLLQGHSVTEIDVLTGISFDESTRYFLEVDGELIGSALSTEFDVDLDSMSWSVDNGENSASYDSSEGDLVLKCQSDSDEHIFFIYYLVASDSTEEKNYIFTLENYNFDDNEGEWFDDYSGAGSIYEGMTYYLEVDGVTVDSDFARQCGDPDSWTEWNASGSGCRAGYSDGGTWIYATGTHTVKIYCIGENRAKSKVYVLQGESYNGDEWYSDEYRLSTGKIYCLETGGEDDYARAYIMYEKSTDEEYSDLTISGSVNNGGDVTLYYSGETGEMWVSDSDGVDFIFNLFYYE